MQDGTRVTRRRQQLMGLLAPLHCIYEEISSHGSTRRFQYGFMYVCTLVYRQMSLVNSYKQVSRRETKSDAASVPEPQGEDIIRASLATRAICSGKHRYRGRSMI